jgi:homoserine O-acetyltransferase
VSDKVLELGDLELESGETLGSARLLYTTHGTLNEARDNAILYPHMYSGTPSSLESTIAPGRALDPEHWFIVCPAQLGGGLSSSPSNTDGAFPNVSVGDDVTAQHHLLTDVLGIDRLALTVGFSMGAQQAYDWAVRYPHMVDRLAAVAGNARTTAYNALVLRFAEEALEEAGTPEDGLRRHAHVWAATGLSAELYRIEGWRDVGFESVDDLVERLFEEDMAPMNPDNLLCMCRKWRLFDASRHTNGDLAAALGRITARTRVIPFSTDSLFPVAASRAEQELIPHGELHVIESPWGHWSWEMTPHARGALDVIVRDLLGTG